MNRSELRAAMARKDVNSERAAKAIGISADAFRRKMRGATQFRADNIAGLAVLLDLTLDDINVIFFDGMFDHVDKHG